MSILIQKVRKTILKELLKPFVFDTVSPLHIALAGMTYPDPSYFIRRMESDVSVIEYIMEGKGYVYTDGERNQVTQDTIYFLTKGDDHIYHSDPAEPYKKIFLNVSGSMCRELAEGFGLTGKHFFRETSLRPLFERIIEIISSDMSDNEMQSSLRGILTEILSRLSYAQSEMKYSKEAMEMKNFIDSNHFRILSSRELSRLIFRSPDYCQKLFKREFGMTPYAYQLKRKMDMAKILLSDTNTSVSGIAASLGYTDVHYFSNLFKDKCGMRPLAFRKSKRN